MQQAGERRAVAADGHLAARLPRAADAADERAQPGRVDERHRRHVDQQLRPRRELAQRLAELADVVGVELTDGAADGVAVGLLDLDVEQGSSSGLRNRIVPKRPSHNPG